MKKTVTILVLFFLIALSMSSFAEEGIPSNEQTVNGEEVSNQTLQSVPDGQTYLQIFPDQVLAKHVAEAAGKEVTDIVTQEDLNKVTSLSITSMVVTNLEGMEYLTNLTSFSCVNSGISDLTPLSSLTQLKRLMLRSGKKISDITPLANLTNLEYIDLGNCQVSDISALKNLTHLTTLTLDDNKITDVSPLSNLANYQPNMKIDVSRNQISDVSPLSGFNSKNLTLNQQQITSTEFTATSEDTIKVPCPIGLDGQPISPRYTSPAGAVVQKDTDGKSYVVWPKSMFTPTDTSNQIFVYMEFGDPSQYAFNGAYRVFADCTPPTLTADNEITYPVDSTVSSEQFLQDVHATTDEGCTLETDVSTAVKWDTVGDYTVSIRSSSPYSNMNAETKVTVHIVEKGPTLTCDDEITYVQGTTQSSEQFLQDIHAETDPNATLTSDFDSVVQMDAPGDYTVEVKAVSDTGEQTKEVKVHVVPYTLDMEQSPEDITFKTSELQSKETLITRDETSPYTITIRDTRAADAHWQLKMSITEPLTSETSGETLNNALVYRDKNGQDTVLQPNQAVLVGSDKTATRTGDVFKIEWGSNEGILLKANLSGAKAETYSTTFHWQLEDAP
ncbi:LapB repeat-containing protein [Listeria costaricensis]|uniref:LapB repeat-containing protein n=1 Tax=Listeria costaricensis TaxID=2026604 RepID=UPI000C084780|nr:LapB repeat-containing protein [Listeria costaricensis]